MMYTEHSLGVLIIEPSGAGGIAHYTYGLAAGLADQGMTVNIMTSHRWMDWPLHENVHVHKVFHGIKTNPFKIINTAWKLRKHIAVVHWQCVARPKQWRWLMRLLPLKRVPWVFTLHNILPHERETISPAFFRDVYRRMQGLIFHTHYTEKQFEEMFPEVQTKTAVIPLGEYGFFRESGEEVKEKENTLLFFGNIRPYKGLDLLLEAMPMIRDTVPDVRLLIAGQALESFQPYQKLIQKHHLEFWVETRLGYQPDEDVPRLFQSASIVVLPYHDIDQSAVLLLALALGRPVVATHVGGIDEVIQDQQTGILVEPNDPKALADGVIDLLYDGEKRKQLGDAARRDAEDRFSWRQIARQTKEFYQAVSNDAHS